MGVFVDPGLRVRCRKHEGNNSLRVQAFVVQLSHLPTAELEALRSLKMCNKRRAAEKILAWRAANPNFKTVPRPPESQAGGGKSHPQTEFSGRNRKSKRLTHPGPGHGPGPGSAGAAHEGRPASGQQQRAASVMPVVSPLSATSGIGLAAMQRRHLELCAMKGVSTRSFANAAAVPFPYPDEGSSVGLCQAKTAGLASAQNASTDRNAERQRPDRAQAC